MAVITGKYTGFDSDSVTTELAVLSAETVLSSLTADNIIDVDFPAFDSGGTYRNRVWDTQVAGSDKSFYWVTVGEPDVSGSAYDGPGTWGVHTSGYSYLVVSPG